MLKIRGKRSIMCILSHQEKNDDLSMKCKQCHKRSKIQLPEPFQIPDITGIKGSTQWKSHTHSFLLYVRVYVQQPNQRVRCKRCRGRVRTLIRGAYLTLTNLCWGFGMFCILICCFPLSLVLWPRTAGWNTATPHAADGQTSAFIRSEGSEKLNFTRIPNLH